MKKEVTAAEQRDKLRGALLDLRHNIFVAAMPTYMAKIMEWEDREIATLKRLYGRCPMDYLKTIGIDKMESTYLSRRHEIERLQDLARKGEIMPY